VPVNVMHGCVSFHQFRKVANIHQSQTFVIFCLRPLFTVDYENLSTYRGLLRSEGHSPQLLWQSLDSVLHRGKETSPPSAPVAHGADDFQCFFEAKVKSVRASTAGARTSRWKLAAIHDHLSGS